MASQTLKDGSSIFYVMRVIAIIPAYNEEETIGDVIRETKKYVDDVIVINDGSTDRTEDVAKKAGAKVVSHVLNRGVGAAVRTGIKVALMEDADYTIQIDGDGQHNAEYIPDFIKMAEKGYDIVICLLYTSPSPRDGLLSRMPSSA